MPDAFRSIQMSPPFGSLKRKRSFDLSILDLRPLIRIAHRITGPILVPQRIIFDFEFVLVLAGQTTLRLDGVPIPLARGQLVIIPPFVPHDFVAASDRCEHVAIHFDLNDRVPGSIRQPWRRRPYRVRLTDAFPLPEGQALPIADVEPLLLEVIRRHASASPIDRVEASLRVAESIVRLLRRSAPEDSDAPHRARLARVMQFVDTRLADPLAADDLAAQSGLSPSHFNRIFSQFTGQSPMEYVRRRRVAEARKLLADPDLSIKEISRLCGFDDAFHFSKVFRTLEGVPPLKYRRSIRA